MAPLEDFIRDSVIEADIAVLNDRGVGDKTIAALAGEHAARVETLLKMIDPSFGRAMLLLTARALLSCAQQIDAATYQEPELTTIPE
jgi:hypothetical protein